MAEAPGQPDIRIGTSEPAAPWLELWFFVLGSDAGSADFPVGVGDPGVLDAEEQGRAAAFVRPRDRERYVLAHSALRAVLADRLAVAPAEVGFVREPCPCCGGPHGRPALDRTSAGPHFSLSHSEDVVLIGVSGAVVGVDVERLPAPELVASVGSSLHPEEWAEVQDGPVQGAPGRFARIWARKEAYLKGEGSGLGRSLRADYLGDRRPEDRPAGWSVVDLAAPRGYAAAAAVRGTEPVLHLRGAGTELLGPGTAVRT